MPPCARESGASAVDHLRSIPPASVRLLRTCNRALQRRGSQRAALRGQPIPAASPRSPTPSSRVPRRRPLLLVSAGGREERTAALEAENTELRRRLVEVHSASAAQPNVQDGALAPLEIKDAELRGALPD
eukprot:tig00000981_g5887.t1